MSSFPAPISIESGENSGQQTNWQAKKGVLLVAESQAPTWVFQIPLYNYVFLRFAEMVESYDRRHAYVGYNGRTPEMVNLHLYNRQMEEAKACAAKGKTFDPLFQFKEGRTTQQFWPVGLTDTPEWDIRDILGRSQKDRVINVVHRGQIKIANYWDSSICGTYHLCWICKMLDIRTKDPVFHVGYGGTPPMKHARVPGVDQVPHWFACAVKNPIDIDRLRLFRLLRPHVNRPDKEKELSPAEEQKYEDNHVGEAVYIGQAFANRHYDKTNQLVSPDTFEFPVTSQEKIRAAKYFEVNLNQST